MNRLAFIRKVLYRLKRRYGSQVDIIWTTSSTVDRATGDKTVLKDRLRVNRMIVLPSLIHREFSYDLAYIAAAKNFTYGGFFDTQERRFIVDTKDLPADFEISVGQYFVYSGKRYDVKQVEEFEEHTAYFITAKQSESVDVDQAVTREISLLDEVSLTNEAEADLL
jgi:hypothetical protein